MIRFTAIAAAAVLGATALGITAGPGRAAPPVHPNIPEAGIVDGLIPSVAKATEQRGWPHAWDRDEKAAIKKLVRWVEIGRWQARGRVGCRWNVRPVRCTAVWRVATSPVQRSVVDVHLVEDGSWGIAWVTQ